jgi:hypothetical protein
MFTRYYGEEVGKTIAHHTTRSRQAEPVMRDIFPRDFITVEVRHRINFVEPGTSIEIPVSEFLEEARRYALGIERAAGPPFVPTGKSPAAWMARNCWGVLEVLGNHRRRESDGDKWQSVTMETILSELDIRSSGNRSCSIRRVVGGLVSFGSVNKSQGPTGLRYRIKHRTVKRKPPRTDDKAPTKQTVT